MTIGERVKFRRKQLGLTQEELAKRLGNSSRASICTVEKDREDLTTTRIAKLAQALETSPAFLMGWVDNPDPNYIETKTGKIEVLSNKSKEEDKEILLKQINEALDASGLDLNKIERSIDFLAQYEQASPEIQAAIQTLLKASQQQP